MGFVLDKVALGEVLSSTVVSFANPPHSSVILGWSNVPSELGLTVTPRSVSDELAPWDFENF